MTGKTFWWIYIQDLLPVSGMIVGGILVWRIFMLWVARAQRGRRGQQPLSVTEYTLENAPFDLRIGLVTDLHERNGKQIAETLCREKPEIICIAGDTFERCNQYSLDAIGHLTFAQKILYSMAWFLNDGLFALRGLSKETDPQEAYDFFENLPVGIPTFLSLGNHDQVLWEQDRKVLAKADVQVLDNGGYSLYWKGNLIQLGGLSSQPDLKWLESFEKSPGYKLLLCHHPDYYPRYIQEKRINLILSGHVHGGQMRIAGRGVFAPGQGLLPKYHHGIYDHRMVVSAGCSNTTALPRWGNPCELVIIQLKKGQKA